MYIMLDFNKIQDYVQRFKSKFELIASISCFYHISYATVSIGVWMTETPSKSYIYCKKNDEWSELFILIIRGCVRILGLVHDILRMNRKPKELAQVVNKYCDLRDKN